MDIIKQRIVVKVGTSTLTHESGSFNLRSMEHLVRVLADLQGMGHEVILVSSGAIGVGTARMGLPERPRELRMKQAAAAVGQCRMMHMYDTLFSEYNRCVAQILLTGGKIADKTFFSMPVPTAKKKTASGHIKVDGMVRGEIRGYVSGIVRADINGEVDLNLISGSAAGEGENNELEE